MSPEPYIWTGEHRFTINGSGMHEDTLRIVPNNRKSEQMFKLILPTLCITYADMAFQNAIGGQQMNYPGSAVYGPAHFDPPVVLTGDDIEKFTYIRGASRVEIGPGKTVVEFPSWEDLVIPRLRIDEKPGAEGSLAVDHAYIEVQQPLEILVKQYADGRHVGGLTIAARHPDYVEPEEEPIFDLWVRVFDARTNHPLQETIVDIWRWDPKAGTEFGDGDFTLASFHYTNADGCVEVKGLPTGELYWFTVRKPGWRTYPRCLRPLPGQSVRLHMGAWEMGQNTFRYTVQEDVRLEDLAALTYADVGDILKQNGIKSLKEVAPGLEITLPCYEAAYHPENWETLDQVARRFGFKEADDLAGANGLRGIKDYTGVRDLVLNEWRFFHAREGDSLLLLDRQFGLPEFSSVPVHKVYRPRKDALIPSEVVAVPSLRLAEQLAKDRKLR